MQHRRSSCERVITKSAMPRQCPLLARFRYDCYHSALRWVLLRRRPADLPFPTLLLPNCDAESNRVVPQPAPSQPPCPDIFVPLPL